MLARLRRLTQAVRGAAKFGSNTKSAEFNNDTLVNTKQTRRTTSVFPASERLNAHNTDAAKLTLVSRKLLVAS